MADVVRGAKEFGEKLSKIPGNAKRFLRRVIRQETKAIEAQAEDNVQKKDVPPDDSGQLEASIKTRSMKRKGDRIGNRASTWGTIYNMAQEYGATQSWSGKYIPGKGFMKEAGEALEDKVVENIHDTIDEAIRRSF